MEFKKLNKLEFKGAIIGMILGDGNLTSLRENRNNSSMRIYSVVKSYIEIKQSILSQLTETVINKNCNRGSSYGKKPLYTVRTKDHPIYTKLRMRFYHNNRKTVDKYIMSTLNELGILLWYLDDGCLDTSCGIKFGIYSNGFNLIEHQYIQKMLNDRFGLRFNIRKSYKKSRAKIYYWLYLKAIDRLKFYDNIIQPFLEYIPQEMMYKIPKREDIERMMNSKSHLRFYEDIVWTLE